MGSHCLWLNTWFAKKSDSSWLLVPYASHRFYKKSHTKGMWWNSDKYRIWGHPHLCNPPVSADTPFGWGPPLAKWVAYSGFHKNLKSIPISFDAAHIFKELFLLQIYYFSHPYPNFSAQKILNETEIWFWGRFGAKKKMDRSAWLRSTVGPFCYP